jgi:hypothetical protein
VVVVVLHQMLGLLQELEGHGEEERVKRKGE